jgi:hypothetical protein
MVEYVQFILCVFALSKNLDFRSPLCLWHVVGTSGDYMNDFPNGQA